MTRLWRKGKRRHYVKQKARVKLLVTACGEGCAWR